MYLETKTNKDKNDGVLQARKYLWNLTEYPETSVWARVGSLIASITTIIAVLQDISSR